MNNREFRTYKRRSTRQRSGYTVSGNKTGGECIIKRAQKYITKKSHEVFEFYIDEIKLEELFEMNFGILAFGGYIYTENNININFELSYKINGLKNNISQKNTKKIDVNDWNLIGFHKEISLDIGTTLKDVHLKMHIDTPTNNTLQMISFDFDKVNLDHYKKEKSYKHFTTKTTMHIPHIYYLETSKSFDHHLISDQNLIEGDVVVLKSCNRCDRYLPINIENEVNTLGFSNHCKKRAPCTHSGFNDYIIDNIDQIDENIIKEKPYITDDYVKTYYGHQLECRACKKFQVNVPLNPKRNSQQFREDSLRRRSLENLVNHLLDKNIIHIEFRKRTGKEFSEYIWEKFNKRCFKCNKKLLIDEMQLDHTMPIAYLYRLDESATCLCSEHNARKRDLFPVDFYSKEELYKLSKITGLDIDFLKTKQANPQIIELLLQNITWFFDEFLSQNKYQKVRSERLTADKIYYAIDKVIPDEINLIDFYYEKNNCHPNSITLN